MKELTIRREIQPATLPEPVRESMRSVMIPKRFRDVSFDSFRAETPSQGQALAAVRAWLANQGSGPMLALVGKQGTGKSHLLYSAAGLLIDALEVMDPKERSQKRLAYPFVNAWYTLADQLRYGTTGVTEGGSRSFEASEIRRKLWDRPSVLIDEVRPTSGTGFDDTELAKFACHAYDNRIAVLITTNYNPLASVLGDAAASRFTQVVIDGPDARQAA